MILPIYSISDWHIRLLGCVCICVCMCMHVCVCVYRLRKDKDSGRERGYGLHVSPTVPVLNT